MNLVLIGKLVEHVIIHIPIATGRAAPNSKRHRQCFYIFNTTNMVQTLLEPYQSFFFIITIVLDSTRVVLGVHVRGWYNSAFALALGLL